jgi:hypothetical protein
VETVRFSRPGRIDFRLTRGPVPHVVEQFLLTTAEGSTRLDYAGELGTDLWALGTRWGNLVAGPWEHTVRTTFAAVKAEAERRHRRGQPPPARPWSDPDQPPHSWIAPFRRLGIGSCDARASGADPSTDVAAAGRRVSAFRTRFRAHLPADSQLTVQREIRIAKGRTQAVLITLGVSGARTLRSLRSERATPASLMSLTRASVLSAAAA